MQKIAWFDVLLQLIFENLCSWYEEMQEGFALDPRMLQASYDITEEWDLD